VNYFLLMSKQKMSEEPIFITGARTDYDDDYHDNRKIILYDELTNNFYLHDEKSNDTSWISIGSVK